MRGNHLRGTLITGNDAVQIMEKGPAGAYIAPPATVMAPPTQVMQPAR